jgi:hypothetical protein
MRARQAVLLTPSKSTGPPQLLCCKHTAPVTPLESALLQVFILKDFNLTRINTYKKTGGWGSTSEGSVCKMNITRHPFILLLLRRPANLRDSFAISGLLSEGVF